MKSNTRYPGRPNYTGDTVGIFGLLHHDTLFEFSGNVLERVKYVKEEKPENEKPVRLYSMVCLNEFVDQELLKQVKKAWNEQKKARDEREKAWYEYNRKAWYEYRKAQEKYRKARDEWEKAWDELEKSLNYEFLQEKVFELVSDCVWNRERRVMIFEK